MENAGTRAWWLLAIGILSAIATLFGPGEPVGGVDLGATGATVFMLTLAGAIWLVAAHGDSIFPDHTSLSERRAWVALVFLALILAAFVKEIITLSMHARPPDDLADLFARRFVERYVIIVVAWALISHLIARRAGGVESDERDLRLRLRADRTGDLALSLIVIAGICVLGLLPRRFLTWWLEPIVLANLLVGVLIARSLVENLMLAYLYRFPPRHA